MSNRLIINPCFFSELKLKLQKPTPPPKPKVILQRPAVDVAATEQLISQLRMENVELQKNLHEQQTTILALRRDLAGASARLTDMAGEENSPSTSLGEHFARILGALVVIKNVLFVVSFEVNLLTIKLCKYIKGLFHLKNYLVVNLEMNNLLFSFNDIFIGRLKVTCFLSVDITRQFMLFILIED